MYKNEAQCAKQDLAIGGIIRGLEHEEKRSPTLHENINNRIANMKGQVERLERVKVLLAEPGGILNVSIEDLRFALSY